MLLCLIVNQAMQEIKDTGDEGGEGGECREVVVDTALQTGSPHTRRVRFQGCEDNAGPSKKLSRRRCEGDFWPKGKEEGMSKEGVVVTAVVTVIFLLCVSTIVITLSMEPHHGGITINITSTSDNSNYTISTSVRSYGNLK